MTGLVDITNLPQMPHFQHQEIPELRVGGLAAPAVLAAHIPEVAKVLRLAQDFQEMGSLAILCSPHPMVKIQNHL